MTSRVYFWNARLVQYFFKKSIYRDFPGGPVVKNPPSNAGDAGSIPGRGTKIPCAAGQLSPRAATTGPAHRNKRPHVPQRRSRVPQIRHDAATYIHT